MVLRLLRKGRVWLVVVEGTRGMLFVDEGGGLGLGFKGGLCRGFEILGKEGGEEGEGGEAEGEECPVHEP